MFGRKKSQESRTPWNKGKLVGQKAPFTLQEILTSDKQPLAVRFGCTITTFAKFETQSRVGLAL